VIAMAEDRSERQLAGFTLLEILAVVLIIGLVSAMFLPGLRGAGSAGRQDEALNVASHLELARQRAIMTGKIHRLLLDVDNNAYRVEWFVRPSGGEQGDTAASRTRSAWLGTDESILKPPANRARYEPIPNRFGSNSELAEPFYFDGVETSEGWLDEGLVAIVFGQDGTTDQAEIVITDPDGFAATLQILPILDAVRIRHEDGQDG